MGSLPNLHELGKDESSRTCSSMSQPHSYPIQNVTNDDKTRILHRHSTHCRNKTRNCMQNIKVACDDFTLEVRSSMSISNKIIFKLQQSLHFLQIKFRTKHKNVLSLILS